MFSIASPVIIYLFLVMNSTFLQLYKYLMLELEMNFYDTFMLLIVKKYEQILTILS